MVFYKKGRFLMKNLVLEGVNAPTLIGKEANILTMAGEFRGTIQAMHEVQVGDRVVDTIISLSPTEGKESGGGIFLSKVIAIGFVK